jgi:esterase/lipase
MRFLSIKFLILLPLIAIITACSNIPDEPAYQASNTTLPIGQKTFSTYVSTTRQWLLQNRLILSDDRDAEIKANTPFEVLPQIKLRQKHGILLVHGLADSPYSFVDVAQGLSKMGFHVRTVLLEGHGSRPADLINADVEHWQSLVEQQVTIFKSQVDKLYLGGFSTGANLVTSYALSDPDIQGLVLISPGFKTKTNIDRFAPILSFFKDWVYAPSLKSQTNYVRYLTTPSNGFAQFYHTSADILFRLRKATYNKPVFIAVSAGDSVLNVQRTLDLFSTRMTHPENRLIWYGDKPDSSDSRIQAYSAKVPLFKVSNFSHMGLLFKPDNSYYGKNGSQRICNNGQDDQAFSRCVDNEEVWYSAWGYREANKAHARLTFNPWFDEMMDTIKQVIQPE